MVKELIGPAGFSINAESGWPVALVCPSWKGRREVFGLHPSEARALAQQLLEAAKVAEA